MFKKVIVFTLFLLVFLSVSLNVKAQEECFEGDIISEIGIGKDSMLFTDDVSEISGKVDWNKSGTYDVLCTKENKKNFIRDVIVKPMSSLEEGIDIIKDIGFFDFSKNNIKEILTSNVLVFNRNEYFVYYNCLSNDNNYLSFVCKYKKNEISIVYSIEGNSEIGGMCLYNDNLFVLITIFEEGLEKIQINKFDNNLKLLSSNRYNSNKKDKAKAIFSLNDTLYCFIDATSNQGLIERSASNKIILVLQVNPYNFNIEKYINISNNYDNEIKEVKLYGDEFFVNLHLNGSNGKYYHLINKSYSGNFIFKINSNLEISIIKCLENNIINTINYEMSDTINIAIWKETNSKIVLKYGEYNNEKTIALNDFKKKITALSSVICDNVIYLFISLDNCLSKLFIIQNEKIITKDLDSFSYNCIDAYLYNGEIYLKMKNVSTRLFVYNNLKIKKYNEKIMANNIELVCQKIKVFINEKEVNTKDFKVDIHNKYGNYENLASIRSDNYLLLYKCKYKMPLICNIENDNTYDPGLILEFNGQATLNNLNIESNYIVDKIGKYQLVINGENSEKIVFNFEVVDILVHYIENENQATLELENIGYEKSEKKNVSYEYEKNENIYNEVNEVDYISYIIIFFIIVYLFYSYGYKKIKNKKVKK